MHNDKRNPIHNSNSVLPNFSDFAQNKSSSNFFSNNKNNSNNKFVCFMYVCNINRIASVSTVSNCYAMCIDVCVCGFLSFYSQWNKKKGNKNSMKLWVASMCKWKWKWIEMKKMRLPNERTNERTQIETKC